LNDARRIEVPRTLDDVCQSGHLALVVYDMQIGILSQLGEGGRSALAKVLEVLEAARGSGLPIFFLRHLSLPRVLMGTFQIRQAMAWQRVQDPEEVRPWFLRDSPGFALVPELGVRPDEAVFYKITFSAFEAPRSRSRCAISALMLSRLSEWPPRSASNPRCVTVATWD
jgi:nicotinamidase-related amidase